MAEEPLKTSQQELKMIFKAIDRRLEGDTPLRQCQLVQLYLLQIFAEICDKYGLRYFLSFGTLLGAIRHGGAIPWDDDLDVAMPYEDYKKFCTIAPDELPNNVLLQLPNSKWGLFAPISRLRDRCSFYAESNVPPEFPSGIFIDIYPLAKGPKHMHSLCKLCHKIELMSWGTICVYRTRPSNSLIDIARNLIMAIVWSSIYASSLALKAMIKLFGTEGYIYPYVCSSKPWRIPENYIFPLRRHLFEGIEFNVPCQSESVLELIYGDWRKLPPEEERNPFGKMKLILPTQAPFAKWSRPYNESRSGTSARQCK